MKKSATQTRTRRASASGLTKRRILTYLKVYVPEPDYLLAMKTLAARVDGMDQHDIRFLIDLLGLTPPEQVFEILEHYYPRRIIKPATQYFVEEVFSS